jgi:hypothetical protein
MDLGYRTIDSPAGPHFAPVEDESLGDRCKFHGVSLGVQIFLAGQKYRRPLDKLELPLLRPLGLTEDVSDIAAAAPSQRARRGKTDGRPTHDKGHSPGVGRSAGRTAATVQRQDLIASLSRRYAPPAPTRNERKALCSPLP